MIVTNDKYELPVLVTPYTKDVADYLGMTVESVRCNYCRKRTTANGKLRILKIEVED